MNQFITYGELLNFGQGEKRAALLERSAVQQGKRIFLSHSHRDNDLVPGVIAVLEGHGGSVYVDLKDEGLPSVVSPATADRLRSAINGCPKFVLLVTPRSSDSKWIPWELGLGDGSHRARNVSLFPSAEQWYEQTWAEQEYLGLYQRIVWGNFEGQKGEWLVLNHLANTAVRLSDWISN